MCVNTRTSQKENNVRESYGDPGTLGVVTRAKDTPVEEI